MSTIFSRFSVYIAAVVIFISWLISNSFVAALEEDTQNMDAVQGEQTQARQFSSMSDGQRDLLRKMADIENQLDKVQNAKASEEDEADAEQQWVDAFETNGSQLHESARELEELAKRIEPSADLNQHIKSSVQLTEAFKAKVEAAASAYKETSHSTEPGQDETNAEGRAKPDEQLSAAYDTITKMEVEYDELNEQVVSLYDKLDAHVSERRESSAQSAAVASFIAYVFYALGTIIGGLGQWLGNKNQG